MHYPIAKDYIKYLHYKDLSSVLLTLIVALLALVPVLHFTGSPHSELITKLIGFGFFGHSMALVMMNTYLSTYLRRWQIQRRGSLVLP